MSAAAWLQHKEGGSLRAVRLIVWITRTFGHYAGYMLLYPICLYFIVFRRCSVRASRDFLARALGRPPAFADVFRHHLIFATTLLDRIHVAGGCSDAVDLRVHGLDAVESLVAARRGALLLGAHLGSFEIMRALATRYRINVKALMYQRNAGLFRQMTPELDPGAEQMLIEIGTPNTLLRVKEALDEGCLVGILGDRCPPSDGAVERTIEVTFMGGPVRLPAGPFLLAATLKAPMILFFGLCRGPRAYDAYFEPLTECLSLDREGRDAQLRAIAQRYADRLESYARQMPYNWFNFYDYWGGGSHGG